MRALLPILLVAGMLLAREAGAQPSPCRVLDPELAGSYAGGCKDGFANGKGEARGVAEYRGEFRMGMKHGRGVKRWPDGDRYDGEFADDRRHGTGDYTWSPTGPRSGERYVGSYRNDLRHGDGTYLWGSGDVYSGPWRDDKPIGAVTNAMVRRARGIAEVEAALGTPGTRACRRVTIGIAVSDWLRGSVVGLTNGRLSVRLDGPLRPGLTLSGRDLVKGMVVNDDVLSWTPCS